MTRFGVLLCGVALTAACSNPPPPRADNREAAYRENNRGVADLERYAYDKAVESFRRAIALDDRVVLPHVNLPIALYYASNLDEAVRALDAADGSVHSSPQVAYIRGLVARGMNRNADAEAAFKRVLASDPDDAGAMINLGQLYLQDRRTDEAIAVLRSAVAREPANATARYALGQALIRSGAREEGARETARFEALRDSGAGVIYSQAYLEQGHYAEALISTGMEADLVSRTAPPVRFTLWEGLGRLADSSTPQRLLSADGSQRSAVGTGHATVVLTDLDLDGDLDLLLGDGHGLRLFESANGVFEDASQTSGLAKVSTAVSGIAVADLDNDGRPDLLLLQPRGISVQRQTDKGVFVPFASQPLVSIRPDSAALLDADHDGDLDILLGGAQASSAGGGLVLLRNNGQGAFIDVTKAAGLGVSGRAVAVVPIDFDNRRDVDIVALLERRPPKLFQNQRNESFRDVAADTGLVSWRTEGAVGIATCDLNKDGFADFVAAGPALTSLALSDGRGHFAIKDGPAGSQHLTAIQCADYDNDGLLDVIGAGTDGLRVFRNIGAGLDDVTSAALGDDVKSFGAIDAFAIGDLDADGDLDVALAGPAGVRVLRNDGGSTHPSLRVALKGRVSNRSGIGARVDVRAGSLWQRLERLAVTPPIGPEIPSIGLSTHERPDAIRVLWPAGILQAETDVPAQFVSLVELDRKPSSCPFLYTWNGQSFEFVTDFLGGGELGYWEGPGKYNHPDPDEFVRVTSEQLKPRNGRLELRVTNELEEVAYLDQVQLLSIDHPADVEIYPREGMRTIAAEGLSLVAVRNVQPVGRAASDRGDDMTADVVRRDGRYSNGFVTRPIRGYAETHDLIFETASTVRPSQSQVLLLTGWTDYAFSSDNVAAAQRGWTLEPPRLEVRGRDGRWRTLAPDVGIPVGRPQTLVVDIGDAAQPGLQFRLRTNMRMHWDAIAVADIANDVDLATHTHALAQAGLRWRGYSAIDDSQTPAPAIPDYGRVLLTSPWKVFTGRYTREGDVRSLIAAADDLFVVARTGDEVALTFEDAGPRGARRTYLVGGLGFSKEMDMNSASPDMVLPLPARGLTHYPSVSPSSETRARQRDMLERYNTRVVSRPIPSLDSRLH